MTRTMRHDFTALFHVLSRCYLKPVDESENVRIGEMQRATRMAIGKKKACRSFFFLSVVRYIDRDKCCRLAHERACNK